MLLNKKIFEVKRTFTQEWFYEKTKKNSRETDSNHRPKDNSKLFFFYSPPLYQLSYRESVNGSGNN